MLLLSLWIPLLALAGQSPQQSVEDLNHGAMEAYNAMDINKAGSMLEDALRVAAEGGVTGALLAQTNLNLAIVYVGGLGDNDGGVKYFMDALCADPSVQLDPLTSSPDVQSVFQVAQQKVQQSGCAGKGASAISPGAAASTLPMGAPVTHYSPPEQLTQTPLPLYAEISPAVHAQGAYLYYKGMGMDQWKRVAMLSYQRGVAYQISCNAVWEPKVQYYIEAVGSDGRVVGSAGSANQPIEVPVVAARTQAEPVLPGAPPPASCAQSECPPGVKGCVGAGAAAIGEQCSEDKDCQGGLKCEDDVCTLRGAGGAEISGGEAEGGGPSRGDDHELPPGWGGDSGGKSSNPKDFKRGFFQLGLAASATYVQAGMIADRPPADRLVFIDKSNPRHPYIANPFDPSSKPNNFLFAGSQQDAMGNILPDSATETAWVPDADSADSAGPVGGECAADGLATGVNPKGMNLYPYLLPSRYCVRVKAPGFVPGLAMRAAFGYFVSQRLSLALITRFQFSAGEGSLAHVLLGGRIEYMLTTPKPKGLMLSAFLGGTFGQIQAQPPATGNTANAPWIKSGLQGAHLGMSMRIRVHKHFGFYVAPELDLQFPTFLWNVDWLSGGFEAAF
ncbi:MAG TPA: hypothetical protein VF331_24125 [Polyangiales bacterium]